MWAAGIVVADPQCQAGAQFHAGLERVQVDAFVFQAAPEPFNEDVDAPIQVNPRFMPV
jgi:hypothetical protein